MDISWAFNTPVLFRRFTGTDGWGQADREAAINASVWWEKTHKIVRTTSGEEKIGAVIVLGPLSLAPRQKDLFIKDGRGYRVLNVSEPPDVYSEVGYFSAVLEEVAGG